MTTSDKMKIEPVNFSHLDNLCEKIVKDNQTYRIVHIYASTPNYTWEADPIEGTACVDDVARATVVYLRDFELNNNNESRQKGEELLRFILYMQLDSGLFYNFVLNNHLEINREHPNSRGDSFHWWSARAIWALGVGSKVLKEANPELSKECIKSIRKIFPHIMEFLTNYPKIETYNGRDIPLWLINGYPDLTAELLLGLIPLSKIEKDDNLNLMIERLAEGIAVMQYGKISQFPYGLHASDKNSWHGWGSSQTQALAEGGFLKSAVFEADNFYPHLLIDGWWSDIPFDKKEAVDRYPRIPYAIRCTTLGLLRLYEATNDKKYLKMAGLAGSWFHGNNMSGKAIYNSELGHGYDGIDKGGEINWNSGAESTIETLHTILELSRYEETYKWSRATSGPFIYMAKDGVEYRYRIYKTNKEVEEGKTESIALLLNITTKEFHLLEGDCLKAFLEE